MVAPVTSADLYGLRGVSLDSDIRRIFASFSPDRIEQLAHAVHAQALRREMVYMRDGQLEVINIMLRPVGVFAEQLNYFHYVSLTLLGALKRMPELYLKDFKIREVVPLEEGEARWLWDTWGASHNQFHTVFGRLDAVADLTGAFSKNSLAFIEPNLVGAGGVHLIPTTEEIIMETVVPAMLEAEPGLELKRASDVRDTFMRELHDHAEAIGRPGYAICMIDAKYSSDGPNEQETLMNYYRARGYEIYHADPEELYIRNGEVLYENHRIDVAYRDYETRELADMETQGLNVRPMKHLLRNNQMVSSMAGDFDHKSCFEVFTDPQFSQYFTMDERNMFRRHVLWTRLMRECRTADPTGELIDLTEFVHDNRELLVLKPNRSYGGERILIGPSVTQSEWDNAIEQSLREPGGWVTQRLAQIAIYEFPVVSEGGGATVAPFYVVIGLSPTKYGLAILGRASQKQVVNVAQRGGMLAVFIGQHRAPIAAPKMPE